MAEGRTNIMEVPIYCLTKISKDEEDVLLSALTSVEDPSEVDLVHPKLVSWTDEQDGDMRTLYRDLIKNDDPKTSVCRFFFFLDRQCLTNKEIIIAQPEPAILLYGETVMEECNKILRGHGAMTTIPEWDENLSELVQTMLLHRALTYARTPANAFFSAWGNLDLGNLGLDEVVELEGGKMEMVENPEWDVEAFISEAEKVYVERGQPS